MAVVKRRVEFVWRKEGESEQRVSGGEVPLNEWSNIAVILEDGERLVGELMG